MRATLVCRHKRRLAAWRTRGGGALPTCIRKPQTPKPSCLPACCLLPVIIMDWTVSIHLLIQQVHPQMRVERNSGIYVARGLYELWGRSPYTRMFVARTSH